MTAQIISFAEKWHEREARRYAREVEQLFSVDYTRLNEEELKEFIMRLAAFAGGTEDDET